MLVSATVDVRGLVKIFNGNVRAVDGVSFSLNAAETFSLLGPNGADKITIIKRAQLAGFINECSQTNSRIR